MERPRFHPRDIARTCLMVAVGVLIFGLAAYLVLNSLGAFSAGFIGSIFGLVMLLVGLGAVCVAILLFVGGGLDVLQTIRGRRGE